jgi:protein-S-isoprenylcysteine O-methyltransferase Ste14
MSSQKTYTEPYYYPALLAIFNLMILLPMAGMNMRPSADLWDFIFVLAGVYFTDKFVRYMQKAHAFPEARLKPNDIPEIIDKGIYREVRHPVGAAFIYLNVACVCFARSLYLISVVPVFGAMWYILALWEEKTMLERFGDEYREYSKTAGMFRGRGIDSQRLSSSGYDMY